MPGSNKYSMDPALQENNNIPGYLQKYARLDFSAPKNNIQPDPFNPNAGREEAYNRRHQNYVNNLWGSKKRINTKKADAYFDKRFNEDWNNGEASRRAAWNQLENDRISQEQTSLNYEAAGYIYDPVKGWIKPQQPVSNTPAPQEKPKPKLVPKTNWDAIAASKLGKGKTMQDVRLLQEQLRNLGFDVGAIDGMWGKRTQTAYDQYIQDPYQHTRPMAPSNARIVGRLGNDYSVNADDYGYDPNDMIQTNKVVDNRNSKYNKQQNGFTNIMLGAAMAENPEIMTASGWREVASGDIVQDQQNDPAVAFVRDKLTEGSMMANSIYLGPLFGRAVNWLQSRFPKANISYVKPAPNSGGQKALPGSTEQKALPGRNAGDQKLLPSKTGTKTQGTTGTTTKPQQGTTKGTKALPGGNQKALPGGNSKPSPNASANTKKLASSSTSQKALPGPQYPAKISAIQPVDWRTVNIPQNQLPGPKMLPGSTQKMLPTPNNQLFDKHGNVISAWMQHGGSINKFSTGGNINEDKYMIAAKGFFMLQGNKTPSEEELTEVLQALPELERQDPKAFQQLFTVGSQGIKAKLGAKLNYIQKLKGVCPEGTEKIYLKNGGCMCAQKAKDGTKTPIKQNKTKMPTEYDEKRHERLAIGEAMGKNNKAQQDSLQTYRKLYNDKSASDKYKMGDQDPHGKNPKKKVQEKSCGGKTLVNRKKKK